jgi:hypothetical protein
MTNIQLLCSLKSGTIFAMRFPGLTISTSALNRHLIQKCKVTLKKSKNGKPRRTWTFAKSVCSSKKQGLICTHKEITVALEKVHQQKALSPTARDVTITILGAISQTGVKDISLRKSPSCCNLKEEKGKWECSRCCERSNRKSDRSSFGVPIECNRCIKQKQYE